VVVACRDLPDVRRTALRLHALKGGATRLKQTDLIPVSTSSKPM
jgi:hypothetical protein